MGPTTGARVRRNPRGGNGYMFTEEKTQAEKAEVVEKGVATPNVSRTTEEGLLKGNRG